MRANRSLTLQVAYQVSDNPEDHDTQTLLRYLDRFRADYNLVNEESRHQRFEATQRICACLDSRNVRLRDPSIEEAAVRDWRQQLGFSADGRTDLHPTPLTTAA